MANILREKFPDTFAVKQVVVTEYGPQPMKVQAGLEKRLHNNYYNKIVRQSNTYVGSNKRVNEESSPKFKKVKKLYTLSKDRWNTGALATKKELDVAGNKIARLEEAESFDEKVDLMISGAVYLQRIFSNDEPCQAVENLSGLFSGGTKLLQAWLSYVCDESVKRNDN